MEAKERWEEGSGCRKSVSARSRRQVINHSRPVQGSVESEGMWQGATPGREEGSAILPGPTLHRPGPGSGYVQAGHRTPWKGGLQRASETSSAVCWLQDRDQSRAPQLELSQYGDGGEGS